MLLYYVPPVYLLSMAAWVIALVALFYVLLRYRRARRVAGKPMTVANAALSGAMLLAFVTAGELFFACFADFSDTFNVTNVSKRWLTLHIDNERNNEGFRDRHPFSKYVAGKKRIVFLGDSFTIGHGIRRMEDRFTDRIAAWLEEKQPGKYVVVNLGEPGYEASMVQAYAKTFMGLGNDVSTMVYVYNLNDIEGYDQGVVANIQQIYAAQPRFFLLRDTYLINWLYFRYVQFRQSRGSSYFSNLARSYESPAWNGLRAKLSELHRNCTEANVDFRMVIFPFMQNQLGPDEFRGARRKLVDFCRSESIPVLDLQPAFAKHVGENLVVSRFDSHPNERAHAIAAEAIEKGLLADLVPRENP